MIILLHLLISSFTCIFLASIKIFRIDMGIVGSPGMDEVTLHYFIWGKLLRNFMKLEQPPGTT